MRFHATDSDLTLVLSRLLRHRSESPHLIAHGLMNIA